MSTTSTSMPSGIARVVMTAMVCGNVSASTRYTPEFALLDRAGQRHRLGRGGALVEHRRVRGGQPGQVGDHGLEVQQRLQPALADLRLVRRVRGVPGRGLEDVAADHRRACGCRSSRARSWIPAAVFRSAMARSSAVTSASVAAAGRSRRPCQRMDSGIGDIHQLVDRSVADQVQHALGVIGGRADVPGRERCVQMRHCGAPKEADDFALPLCRRTLQSCQPVAVLLPERFRGGFAPSAPADRSLPRGLRPVQATAAARSWTLEAL